MAGKKEVCFAIKYKLHGNVDLASKEVRFISLWNLVIYVLF